MALADRRVGLGIAERRTHYDIANETPCLVAVFRHGVHEFLDGALVAIVEAAAEGVAEELGRDLAGELFLALEQDVAEFDGAVELFAGGESAGGVDGGAVVVLVAPAAHPIEVFEAEADGVHEVVAGRARCAFAVLGEQGADGQFLRCAVGGGFERGDVGGGRGDGGAEEGFEYPGAAEDGAGLFVVGRHGEDGGEAEDAGAAIVGPFDQVETGAGREFHFAFEFVVFDEAFG